MRLSLNKEFVVRRMIPVLVTVLALVSGGCGSPAGSGAASPAAGSIRIVTTTTVLADLVRNVAGPDVTVDSLVPKGGEVHTFDPAPSDLGRVAAANVVFGNGLGLDEWLIALVADAGGSARIVELGVELPGVEYIAGGGHAEEDGGDSESHANPHLWLNVGYARLYVARIAETLAELDPAGTAGYAERATAYDGVLAILDTSIRTRFEALRPESRRVVSFHDAFPYFAAAYGLEVIGVVVDAPGQDPSAGEVAALIDAIRSTGARAILAEVQFNDRLARQIAAETGATVIDDLYTDSLGEAPIDTYEALIRSDADRILEALR